MESELKTPDFNSFLSQEECKLVASEIARVEGELLYQISGGEVREETWVTLEKLAKIKRDFGVRFKKSIYQVILE